MSSYQVAVAPGGSVTVTAEQSHFADRFPTYLTRFVGREREIGAVQHLLDRHRSVTLCGGGGAGKTRLAIELANIELANAVRSAPRDGTPRSVYWVPLDAAVDPDEVWAAVAAAVSVFGPVSPTRTGLVRALRDRRALLVLDECEQAAAACRVVLAEILRDCPQVDVLAASRVPLQIAGEENFALPPLAAAVDLFLDRTPRDAAPDPGTDRNAGVISDICVLLQGLPLAIELAASWIPVLSPGDLLTRLRQTSETLRNYSLVAVADRHRSMSVILDASWHWLDHEEQVALSALATFVGGFTREAAEVVAGATLGSLATLTERAMIRRQPDPGGGSRYLIHDLVRVHALHYLHDEEAVRSRHFAYMLALVEQGANSETTAAEHGWSHPMGSELGNLAAASRWALSRRDAEGALRMAVALNAFWSYSTPPASARLELLERALALPWEATSEASARVRAEALHQSGNMQFWFRNRHELSRDRFEEAGRLFGIIGDQARAAGCLRDHGYMLMVLGDLEGCRREQLKSLALCQVGGDRQGEAWSVLVLGQAALVGDEPAKAQRYFGEALDRFERLGSSFGAFQSRVNLAEACRRQRHWTSAVAATRQALDDQIQHGFTAAVTDLLDGLALTAADLDYNEEAAELTGSAEYWRDAHEEVSDFCFRAAVRTGAVAIRRQLGEDAWFGARARGYTLPFEQVIRRAGNLVDHLRTALGGGLPRPSGGFPLAQEQP